MNPSSEKKKTFLDYRSSLRKVTPRSSSDHEQVPPKSPRLVLKSEGIASHTPAALGQPPRSRQSSNTTHPPFVPFQPAPQTTQAAQSIHSPKSSVEEPQEPQGHSYTSSESSQTQAQHNMQDSQSSLPRTSSAKASIATPSVYSEASFSEYAQGSRTLLIVFAGPVPSTLQQHLHGVVSRHGIGAVVLLGPQEEVLKKAKMECYTIAGKLEKNVSVITQSTKSLKDMEELGRSLSTLQTRNLFGVITYSNDSADEDDILNLTEDEMSHSWRSSVLFLQTLARHTIPLLTRPQSTYTNGTSTSGSSAPFFALDSPPQPRNPSFHSTAQSLLLRSISSSSSSAGVEIGYAADILPPPPPVQRAPPPPAIEMPQRRPAPGVPMPMHITNGSAAAGGAMGGYAGVGQVESPGLGESPTKLWASWAMQEEV